jgi:hypothetical protein
MTATAHAIVAGAIAAKFTDPVIIPVLAIVSHYIMDSVPHWDFGTNWRLRPKTVTGLLAIADTISAFTVAYILFAGKVGIAPITIATAASLLPDWIETPWYIFFAHQKKHRPAPSAGYGERLAYTIYKFPNMFHAKAQFPLGFFTQVATVAFFLFLLRQP